MKKAVLFLLCFFYFSSLKAEVACPVFNIERVSLTNPRKAASTFFIPENPAVITKHLSLARFGFGSYFSELKSDNGSEFDYEGQFQGIGLAAGTAEESYAKSTLDSYGVNTKGLVGAIRLDETNHDLIESDETVLGLNNSSETYSSSGQAYGIGLFNTIVNFGYSNRKSTEESNNKKVKLDETTRGFSVRLPFGISYGRANSIESYSSSDMQNEVSRKNLANGICIGTGNGPRQENDTNYFQLWLESFTIAKPNFVSDNGNFGKEYTEGVNAFFLVKLVDVEFTFNYEQRIVNDYPSESNSVGFTLFDFIGFTYSTQSGEISSAEKVSTSSSAYSFFLDADF